MSEKVAFKKLELCAQDLRQKNGLSSTEPLKVKSLLQKTNVLTIYKPLSLSFSGMSIKINMSEKDYRFMLINSEHPIGKQHFTVCHELYHLYYQKNFKSEISCTGLFNKKGNPEEYNADIFASYLLLPEMGVWEMIPEQERAKNKISIGTIIAIEQFYESSHSALLFRLMNMGLIDADLKKEFSRGIISLARKFGCNTSLYEKANENEVIGDYGILANKAWEEGVVSESAYYGLLKDLGIDISKFDEELSNGEF
ncbi:MAG: ImmA/IrrE family metallo-endopeptidase [Bacteroidales bacterium]|nr:ImmA/IrrE family metallo-endopeptidase [Bacteroidales bacterium]MDD2424414.1 ImmA/IrrE family metallo-endopeptidase [Bacteroidales bacterium]MDD3988996.1 ImmA/IrrE family metallo-endopeptidase [Bacteroidales bacterium]MDD4638385.1 ImmA/IrrE family metallo-endopeptidase [Bacteroidales bacterium]